MTTLGIRTIRSKVVLGASFADIPLLDNDDDGPLESVRGNAFNLEVGVFDMDEAVVDLSNVFQVGFKIRESQKTDAKILASTTVDAVDLDLTLDGDTWDDETKQHFTVALTDAEMNFPVSGKYQRLWAVLYVTLTTGETHTLAAGEITHHESNHAEGNPPASYASDYLTIIAALAQYVSSTTAQVLSSAQKEQFWANLGHPAYDDLIAANLALDIGDFYYDRTEEKLRQATG